MYGMVNRAVEELLVEQFGQATWERVRARAGLDVDVFVSNEPYPDSLTYDLVAAASAELGVPPTAILERFGEHWILVTASRGYGALLTSTGRTVPEFLQNLGVLHDRLSMIMPHLRPPRFVVEDLTETTFTLHYFSERHGLTHFTIGLLRGLGTRLGTPVTVEVRARQDEGADHDVFRVTWA